MLEIIVLIKRIILGFLLLDIPRQFIRDGNVYHMRWNMLLFYITLTIIANEIKNIYDN